MVRAVVTVLLLAASALASLLWLAWQAATPVAAGGGPADRDEEELRIVTGLLILGAWVLAWRLYRRADEF